MKVVTFQDANVAILTQQAGPVLAALVFASPSFMGRFYDNAKVSWETIMSLVLTLLSIVAYKLLKRDISGALERPPSLELTPFMGERAREATVLGRVWVKAGRVRAERPHV